ncbi:MAG: N-acetylmuramoyl-L-alanine amidase [Mariniphaga sp.]|nr:N-acetylmuramoyl-L-alanine amidase [Mariniphaga sp.]
MKKLYILKSSNANHFYRLLLLIVISLLTNPLCAQNKATKGLETVVIDAGHGGKDPGAVVGKAREKDIVLGIAIRLGNFIKDKLPNVRVVYTRSTDVFVPLFERSVIANKNNADLFISIHANYCNSPAVKGTETYVLGLHRTEDNLNVAKKENSVILLEKDYSTRYEGFDPNLSESYIMFELIQNTHIDQSVAFAGILQNSFRQHAQRASRDVRQAGFLVLRETAMPGVLIETGYLSNQSEANYLMTDEGKETLALSIFNSFKDYKEKYESRLNLSSGESKKESREKRDTTPSSQQITEIKEEVHKRPQDVKQNKSLYPEQEAAEQTIKKANQITFAIQLSASTKKLSLNSSTFKGIDNISEIKIAGYYKYYCLETKQLSKAKQNLSAIRPKVPDAFIVAFKNGQPIPMKEAMNSGR